jgi:hypothetical protein
MKKVILERVKTVWQTQIVEVPDSGPDEDSWEFANDRGVWIDDPNSIEYDCWQHREIDEE